MSTTSATRALDQVRRLILEKLWPYPVKVYLFGSWARGLAGRTSDIDIGVLPYGPLPPGLLSEISHELEDSTVVFPVELVDLSWADPAFRERVVKEGIVWKD